MGAECKRALLNDDPGRLAVPPGFASLTSFVLRKEENGQKTSCWMSYMDASKRNPMQTKATPDKVDVEMLKKSVKSRPWILYNQRNQITEESDKDLSSESGLQKEITHGCPNRSNSHKIKPELFHEDAKAYNLEEVPIFYPTKEEFADTLKYIESIRLRAEPYGICRIVPPPSWQPQCLIKESNVWKTSVFDTDIQRLNKLQAHSVQSERAEFDKTTNGFESKPGPKHTLETFKKHADGFAEQYFRSKCKVERDSANSNQWEPSVKEIGDEYNRIVKSPSEEIEVLHCDNLDTRSFGSGFPTVSNPLEMFNCSEYLTSGWNLNNVPKLPGSLLSFESDQTSSISVPRLHIGMLFSSFRWKVEEHHLYALYYVHLGEPKVWYAIPWRYSFEFEAAVRKYNLDLLIKQPKGPGLSPFILKSEGVPVCHCIQHPREFVLVFPGSCHSGFNCGFNCVEAVNFAPLDWLPHGQNAVEFYREQERITSISHDKLLISAAREAVRAQWELSLLKKNTSDNLRWKDACGEDGALAKALKSRVMWEGNRRKYLCISSQSLRMDANFDAISKQECSICLCDLHLSAAFCRCSANTYSCLIHAKQLCFCPWTERIFLYRYNISELNTLVEALEGKLSAVYRWAREDLNLTLHSTSKDGSDTNPHPKEQEKKVYKFPDSSISISNEWSTVDSIRAEIKTRVLQSNASKQKNKGSSSKELKSKDNTVSSTIVSGEALDNTSFLHASSASISVSSESESSDFDLDCHVGDVIGCFFPNPISNPSPHPQKEVSLSQFLQGDTIKHKKARLSKSKKRRRLS
ncbi:hypothetical protein SLEP1_g826 [Rubroshorea leprosula]|uniref:Lysine-specific demethylase JMJ16 n=1 Tax=Rubroshorea leprosula TaxID=152421 RepID=A0AAV5HIT7_9ROSI|nr:hypothetical protein SLEP1_g826 [Rubroshorea leprosula]